MLDELEWPSLDARKGSVLLLLFHKFHCGAVSIENDKYLTHAHSWKTIPGHITQCPPILQIPDIQWCPEKTLSFPELFHNRIALLLRWSIPKQRRSLWHSLFSQKHSWKNLFFKIQNLNYLGYLLQPVNEDRDRYNLSQSLKNVFTVAYIMQIFMYCNILWHITSRYTL